MDPLAAHFCSWFITKISHLILMNEELISEKQFDSLQFQQFLVFQILVLVYILSVSFYHVTKAFRVSPHSVIAWISRYSLLKTSTIYHFTKKNFSIKDFFVCLKIKWLQKNSNSLHLLRQQTLDHLAKLTKWLTCGTCVDLSVWWINIVFLSWHIYV